ncbi:Platelet-activating factor acetylhydrolase 2 [Portunus trituberculatus]|uniref:1-alkyl-2-acetylglycerophosphocholine esterase n=1 Tax=Portunus trituberculatus TaxID=210409 RepID=A0A5B7JQE8_PORTR|nr:Platelet-activating factor acetylhydrolase 2 [Portunus trituberculatus]
MKTQKWPVVVFSHGLSANRSIYSTVCSELASHGFVVAAVEHREEDWPRAPKTLRRKAHSVTSLLIELVELAKGQG